MQARSSPFQWEGLDLGMGEVIRMRTGSIPRCRSGTSLRRRLGCLFSLSISVQTIPVVIIFLVAEQIEGDVGVGSLISHLHHRSGAGGATYVYLGPTRHNSTGLFTVGCSRPGHPVYREGRIGLGCLAREEVSGLCNVLRSPVRDD